MDDEKTVVSKNSLGLLDLSVDLSSPEIHSGEEFTVYLKITNPFDQPIWLRRVTVSRPSKMYWREYELPSLNIDSEKLESNQGNKLLGTNLSGRIGYTLNIPFMGSMNMSVTNFDRLTETIRKRQTEIEELKYEIEQNEGNMDLDLSGKKKSLHTKQAQQAKDIEIYYSLLGYNIFHLGRNAKIDDAHLELAGKIYLKSEDATDIGTLKVEVEEANDSRVELTGSLPRGVALQPSNTDIWTITLGTQNNLFFRPAQYRLQFNVLYGVKEFDTNNSKISPSDKIHINTIDRTINIRASMFTVMVGATLGGLLGATARALQTNADGLSDIFSLQTFVSAVLSIILSVAAVIFSARKAETQSFISVEDFWGGALIGFLIGFTGTTAFQDLTGQTSAVSS